MAITEYYVDKNAAGAGTGLNATDAWTTIGAAITAINGLGTLTATPRINIKYGGASTGGDYALTTSSLAFNATNGTAVYPLIWRGYNTTIGDIEANDSL